MLLYLLRWTEVAKQLGIKFENLIGDVLVSSAVVAYLGAFTAAFRQVLFRYCSISVFCFLMLTSILCVVRNKLQNG